MKCTDQHYANGRGLFQNVAGIKDMMSAVHRHTFQTAYGFASWEAAHRLASVEFEQCFDREDEAIRKGEPPSDQYCMWETIATLTHEIIRLQRGLNNLLNHRE